jgi:hypothetical protein
MLSLFLISHNFPKISCVQAPLVSLLSAAHLMLTHMRPVTAATDMKNSSVIDPIILSDYSVCLAISYSLSNNWNVSRL